MLPCIVRGSRIYSSERYGLLIPNEYLPAQGVDIYNRNSGFCQIRNRLPWSTKIEFAGGAGHAPVFGLFVFWVLSNMAPREHPNVQALPRGGASMDYSDEDSCLKIQG